MKKRRFFSERGLSLIEVAITVTISGIALMALAVPFVADRSFWNAGRRQTEAQRDAQVVTRAMARMAREGTGYTIIPSAGSTKIDVTKAGCAASSFEGGPSFNSGQLEWVDGCATPASTITLIDGVRSRVVNFTATAVSAELVRIDLEVLHENQENEILQTEIFLRNAA